MNIFLLLIIICILGKPEIPRNIQVIVSNLEIIVKWQAGNGGGLQQIFFIEYRKRYELEWSVIPAESKTSVGIDGLQMDTVYFVRVFSSTVVGESNKTDEIIVKTGNYFVTNLREEE